MTADQRLTRLEGVVERLAMTTSGFVKTATEFHADVTTLLNGQARILQAHEGAIQRHEATIQRLDAMVTRFDEWLRGQGATNGRGKRK